MITVSSFKEAERDAKNFDLVISLMDVDMKSHFQKFHPNQKVWFFDDITNNAWGTPATEKDIQEIIETFIPFQDKKVLIHCHAGISRSPATAIGLKIATGMPIKEAIENTAAQRPIMWANDLIIQLFDDFLNLDGELFFADEQWKLDQHRA